MLSFEDDGDEWSPNGLFDEEAVDEEDEADGGTRLGRLREFERDMLKDMDERRLTAATKVLADDRLVLELFLESRLSESLHDPPKLFLCNWRLYSFEVVGNTTLSAPKPSRVNRGVESYGFERSQLSGSAASLEPDAWRGCSEVRFRVTPTPNNDSDANGRVDRGG